MILFLKQVKTVTRKCFLKNVNIFKKNLIRYIDDDPDILSGDSDDE